LLERIPGLPFELDRPSVTYFVADALTGRSLAAMGVDVENAALAPDGSALATADRHNIRVWDIPPRRPGGIVLTLMIAQVGLLTAWAAWRRSRARACRRLPRQVA